MSREFQLVLVEWADAYGVSADWVAIPTAAHDHRIHSVGWLVAESEAAITIVPHLSHGEQASGLEPQGCGDMTIPRSAVRRLVELQEP